MTYSIVGADTQTREVGGAGTSCLTGDDVYVIYGGVPGHGVVHAQAYYSVDGRTRGKRLLATDTAPAAIVAALIDPAFDSEPTIRQYGVIDVLGRSAGYTGSGTTAYASDRQGVSGVFAYSVQGNILTSAKVLERAAVAFETSGCDLAERLMSALESGALDGEGDSRCTSRGIPSDSAFLQVERPDGVAGDYLSLRVKTSGSDSPLPELRQKLTTWRASHPCPEPTSPSTTMPSEQTGCSCRVTSAMPGSADGWLLCGLLVVVWRRKRAARDLRPI
ncbi:MAG TPA: DUF1028 domain-containing protein [Polyangiaceae bacterium]|nr:DUF1028 domain-containing protein [Polyangiaceae bacterium]